MGSCAAPSAKGDDKFITTDYLQQCHVKNDRIHEYDQDGAGWFFHPAHLFIRYLI
ncbi:TPA: hypothetical protein MFM40_005202 [Klebsiella pneumoniae]|nr:hypothetical protein [Klebsiella pneumoniae]